MSKIIKIKRVGIALGDLKSLIEYWEKLSKTHSEWADGLGIACSDLYVLIHAHEHVKEEE